MMYPFAATFLSIDRSLDFIVLYLHRMRPTVSKTMKSLSFFFFLLFPILVVRVVGLRTTFGSSTSAMVSGGTQDSCNDTWYQRNSTECRERWITKQIMFRYGKWYQIMIDRKGANFTKEGPNIHLKNGFGDAVTVKSILLADLFDKNSLKRKISNAMRIRDLLHLIFTAYGDIGEHIYFPLTWEDNVMNDDAFIFSFNRYYNSSATVLFPLVGYHNPQNFRWLFPRNDNITFWNLTNELIWRGATSGYIHGNQGRMRQSSRLGKSSTTSSLIYAP